MQLKLKHVYEEPAASDGMRVLVDRLWPRGLSRERAQVDYWAKAVAPSAELRRWFGHDPEKWLEFRQRYFSELDANGQATEEFISEIGDEVATFLFAASDQHHNNAVALREYLECRHSK